ncbi:peptidoglycan recognition protein [Streptomyces sp. NPDC019531]|uniref:peptidoglycan recognition protein family protein n=1 Tax=Streptomyces sp. NPDC019531 TaxID=3365062 RepID=UPI00384BE7D3
MVPPGGTPHIADGGDPADSGTMRVRRSRGARGRRAARIRHAVRTGLSASVRPATFLRRFAARPPGRATRLPRPLVLLLACVPGLTAVLVLALCATGVERTAAAGPARTAAAARHGLAPHTAARPHIVPRQVWANGTGEANSAARTPPPPRYDDKVVAVFVHHTDSPNDYDCADAPRIIRYLAEGQTGTRDWDDIGYNFLVDRCGTIYEGRAGGVDRPVTGAHTQGFNHRTAGIAALGTFTAGVTVPREMTEAIAALAAWKLGLADIDPRATVRLTSSNSLSRYAAGTTAGLPALAGHDDGYTTTCPGAALSALLPQIRERAARLQGRT